MAAPPPPPNYPHTMWHTMTLVAFCYSHMHSSHCPPPPPTWHTMTLVAFCYSPLDDDPLPSTPTYPFHKAVQLRIQGGFEGFDEPPLAGESLCTTTPPVDNIKTNCFSCPSCIILLFQVPPPPPPPPPRPWVAIDNRLIGVSLGWARVDEHPAWRDYLPLSADTELHSSRLQTKNSLEYLKFVRWGRGGFVDSQTSRSFDSLVQRIQTSYLRTKNSVENLKFVRWRGIDNLFPPKPLTKNI